MKAQDVRLPDGRIATIYLQHDETLYLLCRDCKIAKTMVYVETPETCPRLAEHTLCDCGQEMERVADPHRHLLDVVEREDLKRIWQLSDDQVDQAIAGGRLPAHGHTSAKHHWLDHIIDVFGEPSAAAANDLWLRLALQRRPAAAAKDSPPTN